MAADENCSEGGDLQLSFGSDGRLRRFRSKALGPPPSTISKLQDDLLMEILARLPDARSAFRCRPVCRRWRSLVSNPDFRRRFLSHHQSESGNDHDRGIVLSSEDAQSVMNFLPVPDDIRPPCFSILSSCNDLVLCGFHTSNERAKNREKFSSLLFVCNPFTKQWIALPVPPNRPVPAQREPSPIVSLVCGSGSDQGRAFVDRFRVVRFATWSSTPKMDLFCSESGEWTEIELGLVHPNFDLRPMAWKAQMAWCDGKLYWVNSSGYEIVAWDPFSPKTPPKSIAAPRVPRIPARVCASQGALHFVALQHICTPVAKTNLLMVQIWREEHSAITWRKPATVTVCLNSCQFVGSSREDYIRLERCDIRGLHPSNPDIVFLEFSHGKRQTFRTVFTLNARTRELAFFADRMTDTEDWRVFNPRFACWPSPIPNYEKLQGAYRGSCKWLVQSIESTRAQKTAECQSVEGVKQQDRSRKHNRSDPSPQPLGNPVKKKKKKMVKDRSDQLADVVHALQATPDIDDQLMLDACDLFEDDGEKAAVFLALDGRIRKKWLLRKLRPNDSL